MKKYLFILACAFLLYSHESFALISLKPNLTLQMQKQEWINKENKLFERKYANKMRLAELRAQKWISTNKVLSGVHTTKSSLVVTHISTSPSSPSSYQPSITNVDISRVRDSWFSWYNTTRLHLGLGAYWYDNRLDSTAHDWNIEFAKWKGQNHHRRNPSDSYYDFPIIDAWFTARGINPIVINRSKNTENVWYGYYNCTTSDCTNELIDSIHSTFDFFMSEKGKSYDAHYRSIVNPYFTKMGFDIIVVPSEKRYYITIHYITK